ncbi:zf-CHY-domain-containing protein [Rozella allomycis CSF55]|uniref:Zf-CHY-domain-containing protein n=1 Tax=Rozella allomycis (strain CSF55) TaxID=988480 RepID=A0A4P9YSB9_ROZAC|nr:zf-CHY-domain-containing protein [Rozella allomycis CSF55]
MSDQSPAGHRSADNTHLSNGDSNIPPYDPVLDVSNSRNVTPFGINADHDQEDIKRSILSIHRDKNLTLEEKTKRIQRLMTGKWVQERNTPKEDTAVVVNDTDKDIEATKEMGCKHYRRGNKIFAKCCGKWYVCRFCHNENETHEINRHKIEKMLCMKCNEVQDCAKECQNCGEVLGKYYCDICHFWDNDESKSIYHCHLCGICRIGKGLDIDFYHCMRCDACISIDQKNSHKCIEKRLQTDCPICFEDLFHSTRQKCGHPIHNYCFEEYRQTNYVCPVCLKSVDDMSAFNAHLDEVLSQEVMPEQYKDVQAEISCNDCEKKSCTKYHFIYHKCQECGSYNTKVLGTFRTEEKETYSESEDDDDENK